MSGDLHFLDIVFFAMVAAFLVLRLRSVLGRRTGNEKPPVGKPQAGDWNKPREDNVVDLPHARRPMAEPLPEGKLGVGVATIRAADPSFTVDGFLSGARMAFELIVDAFSRGDKKALRPLLSDAVYHSFAQAIDSRERAGEIHETELMGIRKIDMADARMDGSEAVVTVRVLSEQINLVKDLDGRILEGDPQNMVDVTDIWTFRRDTRSSNPNWQLAATSAPEDSLSKD